MNNIYFIECDNHDLINNKIKEIVKDNKLSLDSLITYDMEEVNIYNAIMDLDTYGFFNEMKMVYCKNASFLGTSKSEIEHDIDAFTKYLNNPNPNNILIISCDKADGKKNIVKLLRDKAKIVEINIDLKKIIKQKTSGYEMKIDAIDYLIESCASDYVRINNELDKLMELKFDDKKITKEDIDLIVIKKLDNNIFDLIDAIISKNKKKSLSIYREMTYYGEDIFKIFVSLANQIRLIYQVKVLRNLSNDEIASQLNLKNPKQVMAIRYKIDKYSENDLLDYLYKLAIMDEELKLGKSIDKIVFPTFIASL